MIDFHTHILPGIDDGAKSIEETIELLIEGDVILDVAFHGGCNGNLKGITALVKGQKISDVKERLSGITCGGKNTSCPDQFAQLLAAVQEK